MRTLSLPVVYFFFRSTSELQFSVTAYQSVLTQILHEYRDDKEVFDQFSYAMMFGTTGQRTGSRNELFELLQLCSRTILEHVIVLDGIDECADKACLVTDLVTILGGNSRSKLILFSRPNVLALRNSVSPERQLSIGKSNTPDICLYLRRKLRELYENGSFPPNSDIEDFTTRLTNGADGMFLWARLIIGYLGSQNLEHVERSETIAAIADREKLEVMYLRIVRLICRGGQSYKRLAQWIILWLTFSEENLTAKELEETTAVLGIEEEEKYHKMKDFDRAVVMACSCLVEKANFFNPRSKCQEPCFRFMHETAKKFFKKLAEVEDPFEVIFDRQGDLSEVQYFVRPGYKDDWNNFDENAKRDLLYMKPTDPNMEIVRGCLQYLTYIMPAQSFSDLRGPNFTLQELHNDFPLSRYATRYWTRHLAASSSEIVARSDSSEAKHFKRLHAFLRTLSGFLQHKETLRTWIEALYTFGLCSDIEDMETWVKKIGDSVERLPRRDVDFTDPLSGVKELARFLSELDRYWGTKLTESPESIWKVAEITAFTPSRLLGESRMKVTSFHMGNPLGAGKELSNHYLCKISAHTADGQYLAKLSIWPSSSYETLQKNSKVTFTKLSSPSGTSDWLAQYEIWTTHDSGKRLVELEIPLDPEEMRLQMLQSLWQDTTTRDASSPWKMQFPIAISPTLHQFTILRTVYSLSRGENKTSIKVKSSVIPLGFNQDVKSSWTVLSYCTKDASYRGKGASYSYWFRFSGDGRWIFFIDHCNVGVYSLYQAKILCPRIKSFIGGIKYKANEPMWAVDVAFHPVLPLLAYRVAKCVYLWAFTESSSHPILHYETPRGQLSYPKTMNFSSCGKHLVIQEDNSKFPHIHQIPFEILRSLTPNRALEAAGDGLDGEDAIIKAPQQDFLPLQFDSKSMLHGNQVSIRNDGSSMGFMASNTKENVSFGIWRSTNTGFEQEAWEISKLPQWDGMKGTTASIKLPEQGQPTVTFILNKAVQPENTLTNPFAEHLPAMVQQDIRDIRKSDAEGNLTPSSSLQDASSRKRHLDVDVHEPGSPSTQRPRISLHNLHESLEVEDEALSAECHKPLPIGASTNDRFMEITEKDEVVNLQPSDPTSNPADVMASEPLDSNSEEATFPWATEFIGVNTLFPDAMQSFDFEFFDFDSYLRNG